MNRAAAPLLALTLLASSACVERSQPGQAAAVRLRRHILDAPPPIAHPLDVSFGGKVRLIGYELEPAGAIAPGQPFTVTMLWQCDERIEPGWQLFTHLLDEHGQRLPGGHVDQVGPLREVSSGRPALPPSEWRPGKVYRDEQPLRMPASATGTVSISVGLWREDQRMPTTPPAAENRAVVVRIPTGAAGSATSGAAPGSPPRPPVPELVVPRLPARMEPPVIDGKLDDPAWATAASTGPFVDVSTGLPNTSFPVDGSARMIRDDRFLYVAFDVRDTNVRGELRPGERDQHLWEHECVELMIDPDGDGDNRDYVELQVSPQNLVFDSRFDDYNRPRGGPDGPFGHQDWSFTGSSAAVVDGTLDDDRDTDRGYRVELALAWSSFAGPSGARPAPAPGDVWRVNLYAMKRNSGVAWSPILGEGNFHRARRFGRLVFR